MPPRRASKNAIQDGIKVGGRYVASKIADKPAEDVDDKSLELLSVMPEENPSWETVTAKLRGKTVRWHRNNDGTVTCDREYRRILFDLARSNPNYWEHSNNWLSRNPDDVAVWAGDIVKQMLEDGQIDTQENMAIQSALLACHSYSAIPEKRIGRHRLSVAFARNTAAVYLHDRGVSDVSLGATGGVPWSADSWSDEEKYVYLNLIDVIESWDYDNNQAKTYNGDNDDLAWRLLTSRAPPVRRSKDGFTTVRYIAHSLDSLALTTSSGLIADTYLCSLVMSGCFHDEQFSEMLFTDLTAHIEDHLDPVYVNERTVFKRSADRLSRYMSQYVIGDPFDSDDDDVPTQRLERGVKLEQCQIAHVYARLLQIVLKEGDYRTSTRSVVQGARLLSKAKTEGWDDDPDIKAASRALVQHFDKEVSFKSVKRVRSSNYSKPRKAEKIWAELTNNIHHLARRER